MKISRISCLLMLIVVSYTKSTAQTNLKRVDSISVDLGLSAIQQAQVDSANKRFLRAIGKLDIKLSPEERKGSIDSATGAQQNQLKQIMNAAQYSLYLVQKEASEKRAKQRMEELEKQRKSKYHIP